jgi:hypothetical protein
MSIVQKKPKEVGAKFPFISDKSKAKKSDIQGAKTAFELRQKGLWGCESIQSAILTIPE